VSDHVITQAEYLEAVATVEAELKRLEANVDRLTAALAEEQAASLQQAEIARDALTEVERLTACWSSLTQLVALKDGPRDDTYYSERESAWAGARKALAEYEPPARLRALWPKENDRG